MLCDDDDGHKDGQRTKSIKHINRTPKTTLREQLSWLKFTYHKFYPHIHNDVHKHDTAVMLLIDVPIFYASLPLFFFVIFMHHFLVKHDAVNMSLASVPIYIYNTNYVESHTYMHAHTHSESWSKVELTKSQTELQCNVAFIVILLCNEQFVSPFILPEHVEI